MKKLLTMMAVIILLAVMHKGYAQNSSSGKKRASSWIPDTGFWVIQSTVKNPDRSTICFYNGEKVLVYKEQVKDIRINLKRKKVLMRLRNVLEQSLLNWDVLHVAKENQMLVADLFRR